MKYNLDISYKQKAAKEYFQKLLDKKAYIEIREIRKARSINQNALYWLWLTAIQSENGMDKNELHYMYRALFLPKNETDIVKYVYPAIYERIMKRIRMFDYFAELVLFSDLISYSTTEIDTKRFTEYMEKIRDHAALNMGVTLLTLEEEHFDQFYNEYYRK